MNWHDDFPSSRHLFSQNRANPIGCDKLSATCAIKSDIL